MNISLPDTLDLDSHIKEYPPSKIDGFKADKLAYMLSLLISVPAHNKDVAKNEDGWVPLFSGELAKISKNYRLYLEYAAGLHCLSLEDNARIIEIDKTYSASKHESRRYRFREKYRLALTLTDYKVRDKALSKGIQKEKLQEWNRTKKLYPNLVKWFNSDLEINGEAARTYVQKLRIDDAASAKGEKPLRYLSMLHNIASIESGRFHLKVDSNIQRLHTNLTNLKSELRHFLTYKGESLVSIDITSSQPYMSLALLSAAFYKGKKEVLSKLVKDKRETRSFNITTVAPKIHEELLKQEPAAFGRAIREKLKGKYPPSSSQLSSLIMFSEYMHSVDSQDVDKYESEISKGNLYEYLAYRFTRRTGHIFVHRKEIKEVVFTVLFTSNNYFGQDDAILKREFRRVFPSVYDLFKLIKKGDKSRLARLLQSIESWLVLDKICSRISRERPSLAIFTIHDSVLTTKGNEDYVRRIMEEELQRYIKVKPQLTQTYLEPDKIIQSQGLLDRERMGLMPL